MVSAREWPNELDDLDEAFVLAGYALALGKPDHPWVTGMLDRFGPLRHPLRNAQADIELQRKLLDIWRRAETAGSARRRQRE